jgi:hypothetical protein
MNPFIVEESQARYQARVDAAEAWRLEQAARAATTGMAMRLRDRRRSFDRLGDAGEGAGCARRGQPVNGSLSADVEYELTGCGRSVIVNRRSALAATT